jgi:DNA polymerase (family 10)
MQRRSIPAILEEIGALLEIEGENPFKAKAYYNAARTLAGLDDLDSLIAQGRIREIKGIGETLSANIIEYRETGKIASHEELKKRFPVTLIDLLRAPSLSPRNIRVLYEELGIASLSDLECACKENRLVRLPHFGEKTQARILRGIEFLKRHMGEFLFGEAYPLAEAIKERLGRACPEAIVEICGPLRRKMEVVRNIDILACAEDRAAVVRYFTSMPAVEEAMSEHETEASCLMSAGIVATLRVVDKKSFPCALIYHTGSREHWAHLRASAAKKGFNLSERGLFKGGRPVETPGEAEIYDRLGLSFVPPELREDQGEIEAAGSGRLPRLVEASDLAGALHVHTDMSDGVAGLSAVADAARRMGLSYIGVCDHSRSAYYAGGLKADDVLRQWEAIDAFNNESRGFHFFKGIESDILPDGSLDYEEDLLAGFDFVVASVHSGFRMSSSEMEARIIRAMDNPYTTILGHPTGRLLLSRDPYEADMNRIIEAAAARGVMIELNASPYRLDIDWRHLRAAKALGVMVAIDPDAHSAQGIGDLFYGVGIARKGWLEASDVVNTRSVEEVRNLLSGARHDKKH